MSIEANKQVAMRFFERFSAGKKEQLPAAGVYGKEKIGRLFYNLTGQLKGGLRMTVKGMIAEGDKVAVEVESYGELKNGRVRRLIT